MTRFNVSPTAVHSSLNYRPEIDGLRALAVLLVISYHAFPEFIHGGFIGVDIFFVISGYLISSIIIHQNHHASFSLTQFYIRRIKRIFPALIVVLLSCLIAGWFIMFTGDLHKLGLHSLASATFFANIMFWHESGYFDDASITKPLLHLWSLGVEEQFYILWPLLLGAMLKYPRHMCFAGVIGLTALSFLSNILTTAYQPDMAFFWPHTRFWELLVGAFVALLHAQYPQPNLSEKRPTPRALSHIHIQLLSSFALALLVLGVLLINDKSLFPGWWAALPVAGAALLIALPATGWVQRLLSHKIMVGIGLISYPLYLWHWPLLSFAYLHTGHTPDSITRILMALLSFPLAWLTYSYIEQPIRFKLKGRGVVLGLLAAMLAIIALSYSVQHMQGWQIRKSPLAQQLSQYRYDYIPHYRESICYTLPDQNEDIFKKCPDTYSSPGKPSLVLWGDSHAAHLYPGYKEIMGNHYNIIQRAASACPPIITANPANRPHCQSINRFIISEITKYKPQRVVLSALWTTHDISALEDTIRYLQQTGIKEIDLIGPNPIWALGFPRTLSRHIRGNTFGDIPKRLNVGYNKEATETSDAQLATLAQKLGVNYISPYQIMCNAQGCKTFFADTMDSITTWDTSHFTHQASRYVVSQFPKDDGK